MFPEGLQLPNNDINIKAPEDLNDILARQLIIDKLMDSGIMPGFISIRFVKDENRNLKPVNIKLIEIYGDPELFDEIYDEDTIPPGSYVFALNEELTLDAVGARLKSQGLKMEELAEGTGFVAWEVKYSTYEPSTSGGGKDSIVYDKSMAPQAFFQVSLQEGTFITLGDIIQLED